MNQVNKITYIAILPNSLFSGYLFVTLLLMTDYTLIYVIVIAIFFSSFSLLAYSLITLFFLQLFFIKRYGGFTGDIYGFSIEVTELILLNIIIFGLS
jgi:cobalamin synthase